MDNGFSALEGQYKWGENVERVVGRYDGFFLVVCIREMGEIGGQFAASYKLCSKLERVGAAPERLISGTFDSPQQAVDIAEQLARLHLAGLPLVKQAARRARDAKGDRSSKLQTCA